VYINKRGLEISTRFIHHLLNSSALQLNIHVFAPLNIFAPTTYNQVAVVNLRKILIICTIAEYIYILT
jgi:hypothetical protein